jgi:hypothetical protein
MAYAGSVVRLRVQTGKGRISALERLFAAKPTPGPVNVEPMTGIEPAYSAWEGVSGRRQLLAAQVGESRNQRGSARIGPVGQVGAGTANASPGVQAGYVERVCWHAVPREVAMAVTPPR